MEPFDFFNKVRPTKENGLIKGIGLIEHRKLANN